MPGASSLPRWVLVPAAAGAAFVVVPLLAMATRVDWRQFGALVTSESSLASTLACLVLGVPMALTMAGSSSSGRLSGAGTWQLPVRRNCASTG